MTILPALLLVAILVFIHEFGHFIVAKWCGVHVQVLSLGYGRRIWGFDFRGTDYRLSLLPLGGYVRMSGADPFGEGYEDDLLLENPDQSFMRKPVWKRLLIVAAGPAFNLMLPIVVFTLLFMAGEPQPVPQIGGIHQETSAAEAGLLPNDRITSVDGVPVPTWGKMLDELKIEEEGMHALGVQRGNSLLELQFKSAPSSMGLEFIRPSAIIGVDDPNSPAGKAGLKTNDTIEEVDGVEVRDFFHLQQELKGKDEALLKVLREEEELDIKVVYTKGWMKVENPTWVGVDFEWGIMPATIFVSAVSESLELDSGAWFVGDTAEAPAFRAGLQTGDRFYRLDGQWITSWSDVLNAVEGAMAGEGETSTVRPVEVEIIRDGVKLSKEIEPVIIRDTTATGDYRYRPLMGVARGGEYVEPPMEAYHYSFIPAVSRATSDTIWISSFIVKQLGKLVTGQAAVEKSLGGPVEIVRQASKAAEEGLFMWVRMMAMLSISLGIVNLLPVPILDGGQIMFYSIEGIRGRPVSPRIRELAQQAGVLFLVFLMLIVMFFDIGRLLGG